MAEILLPEGADLLEWDGCCIYLVGHLIGLYGGDLLYVEGPDLRDPDGRRWKYHAALLFEGVVHDAWFPHLRLPPDDYVLHAFGVEATWEINPGAEDGPAGVEPLDLTEAQRAKAHTAGRWRHDLRAEHGIVVDEVPAAALVREAAKKNTPSSATRACDACGQPKEAHKAGMGSVFYFVETENGRERRWCGRFRAARRKSA